MLLKIERYKVKKDSLCGELFVDDHLNCLTLEELPRPEKIPGKTGIPAGRYKLLPRREGQMYHEYCVRFKEDHPMIWLQDVPNFEYIYIHIGNTLADTDGCILVGCAISTSYDGNAHLTSSTAAYRSLHKKISSAWQNGEEVWLEVVDSYEK